MPKRQPGFSHRDSAPGLTSHARIGSAIVILTLTAILVSSPISLVHAAPAAYFDHVVFIIMENEGIDNICGPTAPPCANYHANTPYMSSLANNYTLSLQYTSVYCQPKISTCGITSQPNYLAIIGGSTFTCTSSCPKNLPNPTIVDRLQASGLTWKAYIENQAPTQGCDTSNSQPPYNPSHNPFINFAEFVNGNISNSTLCNNIVQANPSSCGSTTDCVLINDLNSYTAPNFMWLTPNDCNNMHADSICTAQNGYNGCTTPSSSTCIHDGDSYLASLVPNILNSKTFTTTRSALFITFDEGQDYCPLTNTSGEDCIYAIWAGPAAKPGGYTTTTHYNHYSFLKTLEANWNLPTLTANDASANPMTDFLTPSDFTVRSSTNNVTIGAGNSSNLSLTFQSLNGFRGNLTLSTTTNPPGPTPTLDPSSILLPTQTNSTLLTITIPSNTTEGNYTLTVTAQNGSLAHNVNITIIVPDVSVGGVLHGTVPAFAAKLLFIASVIFSILAATSIRSRLQISSRKQVRYEYRRARDPITSLFLTPPSPRCPTHAKYDRRSRNRRKL